MDEKMLKVVQQLFDAHKKMIFAYTGLMTDVTRLVITSAEKYDGKVDGQQLLELMKANKDLVESLMADFEKIGNSV